MSNRCTATCRIGSLTLRVGCGSPMWTWGIPIKTVPMDSSSFRHRSGPVDGATHPPGAPRPRSSHWAWLTLASVGVSLVTSTRHLMHSLLTSMTPVSPLMTTTWMVSASRMEAREITSGPLQRRWTKPTATGTSVHVPTRTTLCPTQLYHRSWERIISATVAQRHSNLMSSIPWTRCGTGKGVVPRAAAVGSTSRRGSARTSAKPPPTALR